MSYENYNISGLNLENLVLNIGASGDIYPRCFLDEESKKKGLNPLVRFLSDDLIINLPYTLSKGSGEIVVVNPNLLESNLFNVLKLGYDSSEKTKKQNKTLLSTLQSKEVEFELFVPDSSLKGLVKYNCVIFNDKSIRGKFTYV